MWQCKFPLQPLSSKFPRRRLLVFLDSLLSARRSASSIPIRLDCYSPIHNSIRNLPESSKSRYAMPLPFAGYRSSVKRVLQDLHLLQLERVDITPTVPPDAPELRNQDEVDRELLQAATSRNQSLPINQLPNELLIRIFLLMGPLRRKGRDGLAWIKLMLVCRYWRDVALASPGMWRSIDIGRNPHWTDLALTRSDPATLDIYTHNKYLSQDLFTRIYPHAHRIRSLAFSYGMEGQWSPALLNLFDRPMPALEALTLSMQPDRLTPGPTQSSSVDIQLSSQRFPGLQLLSLSYMAMPRDSLLFSKLHSLTLDNCTCDCSLDQFLDILSSCSMLRNLFLISFLNHLTGNWPTQSTPERAPISLPRIAVVFLARVLPRHSSQFLAHVLLPAKTCLVMQVDIPTQEPDSNDSLQDAIPQNHDTVLPVLHGITEVELYVQRSEYIFRGASSRSAEKYLLGLQYCPVMENPWDRRGLGRRDLLMRSLADLVAIFQPSSLRHLSIQGLSVAVTQAKWREVLDAFPRLRVLRINDDAPMVALVGALQSESPSIPGSEPHNAGRGPSLPCPQLRFLALEIGCDMYGPFLDMLLECVRRRAEKGSPLPKLEVQSYSAPEAVAEDWTAFVQGLEGLVPDVSYLRMPDRKGALTINFNWVAYR